MNVCVLKQIGRVWHFRHASESTWRIRRNRDNDQYWSRLVREYHPDHWEGARSAVAVTGSMYDDAYWEPLVPGSEIRHGIGRTYWDGRHLVEVSGSGNVEKQAWMPGEPTPVGSCVMYWDDLQKFWAQTYVWTAVQYVRRYDPNWSAEYPQLAKLAVELGVEL